MPIAIALANSHPDRHAATGAGHAANAPDGTIFSALLRSSAASESGAAAAPIAVALPAGQAAADGAVATDLAAHPNLAPGAAGARAAVVPMPTDAAPRLRAAANLAHGAADARAAALTVPIDAAHPPRAAATVASPRPPAAHGGRNRVANPDLPPRATAPAGHPAGDGHAARTVAAARDAKVSNLPTLPPIAPAEEPGSGSAAAHPPPVGGAIDPALVAVGAGQALAASLPQRVGVADAAPIDAGRAPAPVAAAHIRSRPRAPAGRTQTHPSVAAQRPDAKAAGAATAAATTLRASAPVTTTQPTKAPLAAAGQAQAAASVAAQPDDDAVAGAAIAAADAGPTSAPVAAPQPVNRSRSAAGHAQAKASVAAPREHGAAAGTAIAAADAGHPSGPVAGARAVSRPTAGAGDARAAAAVDAPRPAGTARSAEIAAAGAGRSPDAKANASGARAAEDPAVPPDAAAQTVATMMTMPMQSAGDDDPPADTARAEGAGIRRLGADRPGAAGNAREATSTGEGQRGADAGPGAPVTAATDPAPRAIATDAPTTRPAAAAAQRQPAAAAETATESVRERSEFDLAVDSAATPAPPTPMVAGAAATTPAEKTAVTHTEHSAVREARIATAVDDPGFAPAIGATLAVLTRDGVQQARLHLHPAEMGPITVQIALDGQSARVDFHAAVAATRQALESALPALAGALRESGLTLTGGGVFQQSPGRQGGDPQPGHWGGVAQERVVDELPAASPRTITRRGLVDLVA